MVNEKVGPQHEHLVQAYFAYIRDLRAGREGTVEKLLDLWDADGTFEFCGTPPLTGTFHGRNAIHALYKNRFHAKGMPLKLEGRGPKAEGESTREVALGVVDTEVHRVRILEDKAVAGWTTLISTSDGRGFQVAGSHTFTFKNGKISSLKIVASPKADAAPDLSLEGLSVNDIGRLSLAAWAVV